MKRWLILIALLPLGLWPAGVMADDDAVIRQAQEMFAEGRRREALEYLAQQRELSPNSERLAEVNVNLLLEVGRLAEAEQVINSMGGSSKALRKQQADIEAKLARYLKNYNLAHIFIQKRIEAEDYLTAILVTDRALEAFPDKAEDLYTLKGEALYKNNDLEEAELVLRQALRIDPLNEVAKGYVEEIRSTIEAQTSKELAEWISIAKDKVGDFIVTFLALFAAFLVNSLIAPVAMRIRLNRARRAFDNGDYDDFTDLIESLLDNEEFNTLRTNLRSVIKQKSYEEVQTILNNHVVTADRLPTLLRVLERENERMQREST